MDRDGRELKEHELHEIKSLLWSLPLRPKSLLHTQAYGLSKVIQDNSLLAAALLVALLLVTLLIVEFDRQPILQFTDHG